MSNAHGNASYDDVLTSILVNEKSILGFLSTIFNFLARRTDFYYVPDGEYENMGFPEGVAEELVVKVLRSCDPKNWKAPNGAKKPTDANNEIMCSTVAQEVEVIADDLDETQDSNALTPESSETIESNLPCTSKSQSIISTPIPVKVPDDYCKPPEIPLQKSCESYNGAIRDEYTWSQTITELDAIVKLPLNVKSRDLKVTMNPGDICIVCKNGDIIIKDKLPHKIKSFDSFWSISEGKLLLHLEKVQDRWWNRFLEGEEPIDLSKIDCSRSLHELPEDHVAKVRELQWNQEQKLKGLPTSDEIRNIEILKRAWNAEGSPFKGKEFDLSVLKPN